MPTIAVKPFVLRDCTLNIKDGATDVGDFELHVSKVEIVPNTSVQVWKGALPGGVVSRTSPRSTGPRTSITRRTGRRSTAGPSTSLPTPARRLTMKFTPKKGTGLKAATVTVTLLPGTIGGTVGTFATGSVSLPVDGQPALA